MASLTSLSQTQDSIKYLLDEIEKKSKLNENLICSIDKWEKEIKKKSRNFKTKVKRSNQFIKKTCNQFQSTF